MTAPHSANTSLRRRTVLATAIAMVGLAGAAEGNRRFPALAAHFPTSARAVFTIAAEDWAELAAAPITLQDFALAPSD